ncbi:hypothetical protein EZV73_11460 [Acidaminobacter sp. JC074]|uniref:hypothetical protein n=1 Tax=Acidaminobacter sp. JC074 TaxID=2530199 RepID=UPI001F0FFC2C|nr:hypothetical protein [Acidaminobacter sp. JC074]MCH4888195.1 hypothetical protein [Acidaminobacter sp. JC074]
MMKIDSYNVEQQAMSNYHRVEREEIHITIQEFRVEDALDISEEGLSLAETNTEEALDFELSDEDKRKIELLETFITWLTGKKFKFSHIGREKKDKEDKAVKKSNGQSGFAMRIYTNREVHEKESMSFSSEGKVKTEDGREIDFELNLHMARETYMKHENLLEVGNFHDPLVLNFDGKGVDFGGKKIKMDLNLDGNIDSFNFLSRGSGFLALDKNDNGMIDSGLELFGPKTNNGFSELRAYDLDGNQWIDENDDVFDQLKIWTVDENGEETLIGLKEAGVGAIYLADVTSNYTLKHGDEDMAKISGSSIYLKENGQANVIHEVDIKI